MAVGAVVEEDVVDKELTGAASVLAEEEGADFLSLAEVEVSLIAEVVSMIDGVVSSTVALAMGTVVEADVVETGVAVTEGITMAEVLVTLEVTPELPDVVEAGLASLALLTEDLDLVIVTKSLKKCYQA